MTRTAYDHLLDLATASAGRYLHRVAPNIVRSSTDDELGELADAIRATFADEFCREQLEARTRREAVGCHALARRAEDLGVAEAQAWVLRDYDAAVTWADAVAAHNAGTLTQRIERTAVMSDRDARLEAEAAAAAAS